MAVRDAVESSLGPIRGRNRGDKGTVALALAYAAAIDDTGGECEECGRHGGDLTKLGPALLATLEALLLSPRARAAAKKAVSSDKPTVNPLDQLAAKRVRKRRTPDLDSTAP